MTCDKTEQQPETAADGEANQRAEGTDFQVLPQVTAFRQCPEGFNPDRYKDDRQSLADAAANPDHTKRDQFTFGAGRRICPGIHVAGRSP